MTSNPRFHSISWRFLVVLLPATSLVAVLTLAIYSYVKVLSAEDNLLQEIEVISGVHSPAVSHPLWTLDADGVNRSIQTLALHPEVACVLVDELDFEGSYQSPPDCAAQNQTSKSISKTLRVGDMPVGELTLYYTSAPLEAALNRELLTGALFFFLLVSVAGVIAFLVLQYTVVSPLRRLMASIRKAESNDMPEAVVWSSQDELGSVIAAYNKMIQRVDDNTRELITAREQAESAAKVKSRFLANMSHELRTPLNAVIGITEMLREEAEENNNDTEPFVRVAASGRHLLRLIDDVLDFSKIEAGKIKIQIEEIRLADLLEEVIATATPLADSRGNRVDLDYTGEPVTLMSDPFRLRQILINLMANACKFTKNGRVRLEVVEVVSNGDPMVRFCVKDTGIGISKEHSEQLFVDFSQADASITRQFGGTGLGLAISQRLCGLLGGEITLESTEGRGSEFSFVLLQDVTAIRQAAVESV